MLTQAQVFVLRGAALYYSGGKNGEKYSLHVDQYALHTAAFLRIGNISVNLPIIQEGRTFQTSLVFLPIYLTHATAQPSFNKHQYGKLLVITKQFYFSCCPKFYLQAR